MAGRRQRLGVDADVLAVLARASAIDDAGRCPRASPASVVSTWPTISAHHGDADRRPNRGLPRVPGLVNRGFELDAVDLSGPDRPVEIPRGDLLPSRAGSCACAQLSERSPTAARRFSCITATCRGPIGMPGSQGRRAGATWPFALLERSGPIGIRRGCRPSPWAVSTMGDTRSGCGRLSAS